MKRILLFALLLICSSTFAQMVTKVTDPVDWVNPLMGSSSKPDLSNGNTYPCIALPWGMNFWTPQTGSNGDGWAYTYDAHKIVGFKQTHQPSPWMGDYGQFSIMPMTKHLNVTQNDRASWFSHKAEVVKPYYYSVYLADHDITTEITPTERAAQFRFTFPKTDSSFIVVDAYDKGSYIKVIPGQNKIVGYSTRYAAGQLKNFKNYFVIYVDKPFTLSRTYNLTEEEKGGRGGRNRTETASLNGSLESTADHALAAIGFKTRAGETVNLRVASSFISIEQAELNLKREIGGDSFNATAQKGRAVWNKTLSRLSVSGGTIDQTRTFYSCLYRMLFFPHKMYELDAKGVPTHYSAQNGEVLPGYKFAGTGFWDTFRALYPFLNLVYPSVDKEMQAGLVNDYKEGGWLPEWSSPGYADCMIGNNSASIVADAYLKGIRGYDINTLWEAVKHGADNTGPEATGRRGVEYYNTLGYVPYDVKINENAARTLEYAYDDFAIYKLGKALGKPESEIAIYKKRSLNYRNLFDKSIGLMRGKNKDGSWETPFNPLKWGDAFTEGNAWHYSWAALHDIQGMIDLEGGNKAFINKLDSIFIIPPVFDDSYYGGVIHEIREMQIVNMGQYAHGNQPIQHMLYLYNFAGEPWKSQEHIRDAMAKLYKATPDGYCGDEDNGQTSAWYIFSAMGFYPVCPASSQYVIGTPLFKSITVSLENGKKLVINAPNNSDNNKYVSAISVNGKPYNNNWFGHAALTQGGVINFKMSAFPNKTRGTQQSSFPYSLSNEK
ncbi:GH92 family glycosyl hydrolase [Mucilaginibacter sp. UR6-11]|uniref:GH92 family glycosyl hydrolase n=1 Tax=Mucilaginibacter sp. UR6-11 TaxID=1435644 RepID=UPI001E450270|nr:GH92 family glycosyl hydrolase [Mucilaginibacter sp. UR6-11]MCC8425475.1 GH92 family glycosyl hydrolase [Mucilaginibacter sp. UR6-11]